MNIDREEDEYPSSDDDDIKGNICSIPKKRYISRRIKHKKIRRRFLLSRRISVDQKDPRIIIDSVTKITVISGSGWKVLHQSKDKNNKIGGEPIQMGACILPMVEEVTSVDLDEGKFIFGIMEATCYNRRTQMESLLITHELRNHGAIVSEILK